MLPSSSIRQNYPLAGATILLFFFIILQQSCKKTDSVFKVPAQTDRTARFFNLPADAGSPVKRVAEALKKQNDTKQFINLFAKNEGFAIWNKAQVNIVSNRNNNTQTNSRDGGSSDTTVIIPLVLDSAKYVNAFILANTYSDSIEMQFYRNSDYQYLPFQTTTPSTVTTAEDFAIHMMVMDYNVFGDTSFSIKDKRLFNNSNNYKDTAHINRTISFGSNNGGYTINYAQTICVTITTTTITNHCQYPPNQCPDIHTGVLGPCDQCQEYCANISTSYSTQCISSGGIGWPSFPPPPPPTGGGGGGGGGTPCPPQFPIIMTNSAIPINCNPIPNPWLPPPALQDTILHPCQTILILQNNQGFKNMMGALKIHANDHTDTSEHGYIYNYSTNTNVAVFAITGAPGEKGINADYGGVPADGLAHNHFVNSLSIFTPKDLWSIAYAFNSKMMADSSKFTLPLVTDSGTQYILMIENITKFRHWANTYVQLTLEFHEKDYRNNYNITETNTVAQNEKNFLQYLKTSLVQDAGLKLFRGNSDFTQWSPLSLDESNNVITGTCQ
jgi:hypothetical protein